MRRTGRSSRPSSFERLENRLFLAGQPNQIPVRMVDGVEVASVQWQGQQVDMLAGRWMLQLDGFDGNLADQQQQASQLLAQAGVPFTVLRHLGGDGLFLVRGPSQTPPQDVVAQLSQLPGYQFVEPDFRYELALTPNDTSFGTMWGLHNTGQSGGTVDADIDAPEAWNITTGSADTVVAMVDSGIDYNHPDLAANIWSNPFEIPGNGIDDEGNGYIDDIRGWDWWGNGTSDGIGDSNPADQNNHGTHTGGTVAAVGNNGNGVVGVAWTAKLMALKIGGSGPSVSGADAVSAMNYILDMKNRGVNVRVSSHSWGGGGFSSAMNNVINQHAANNVLFVAAAGNNGSNNDSQPFYPASYNQPNVISVGNMTRTNARSSTSNYGQNSVDLFAPGSSILSTVRTSSGSYGTLSGTSMAAPHVTGVAALIYSVKPDATYQEVRDAIFDSVEPVSAFTSISVTGGRLNAFGALNRVLNMPAAPSQPDLDAASDRGSSDTDDITSDNTPTFTGTGEAGSTILLFANGVQVGSGPVAGNGTWSVTASALADGVRQITAKSSNGGLESDPSPALAITIDTVAPTIGSPAFNYALSPHSLAMLFSENVAASLAAGDFEVETVGAPGSVQTAFTYSAGSNNAQVTFPGNPVLTDGNYRLTVRSSGAAGGVQDVAGNSLAADFVYDFFFLNGDANHDGTVNLADFNILAANFGQNLRDFTQGDFTFDLTVGLADFNVLASRFGTSLAPATAASAKSSFGGTRIGESGDADDTDDDLLA